MMTEMTRYKQQTDVDDDTSSVGSARTEDAPTGTLTVRYHMGSHWWKSRTALEKALLVGWLLLLLVVTILVAVLHTQSKPQPLSFPDFTGPPDGAPCLTPECVMLAGTILSNMDPKVEPCDDFYQYACGGWNAKNSIPEGKPMWGTLNILGSNNQIILRNVLESKEPRTSEAEEKARVFYRSCMDANKTIEKLGAEPLLRIIQDEFKGWSIYGNWSPAGFDMYQDITASKVKYGSGALFLWGVAEDDKNSTTHILQFDQGGLTLLARNTYLNESEKEVLDAYEKYIVKVGLLLGGKKQATEAAAAGIIDVERKLAAITTPDEERRDDDKLYHLMTIEELKDLAGFMDWSSFINKAFARINRTLDSKRHTVVYAKEYLSKLPDVLKEIQKTDEGKTNLHNYMVWQVAKDFVGYLSQDFREASKDLEKAQMGVTGTEDLWRQCVVATDVALGPALGAMYVREAFPGTSKNMAEDMIKQVRKSFKESLQRLEWMDDKTKKAALEKADSINEMIGYPDYILNPVELDDKYDSLIVKENEFFQNNVRIKEYNIKENLNRLFKPVNKTRWDMSPPTVNAYYSPTRNNIVFPAGILQAPIFHQNNTKSLNYGAVGVVMGHELAHAFDDQGRKYDKNGNLNQWWRPETSKKFVNLTQCMVDQYSQYELRGEHLNGNLTLGENIADNAGLKASYHAYQQWVKYSGDEKPLPGIQLSHSKLFFLGFAQVWCSAITKEAAHLEIMKDSHVPGEFRVYGSLSNSPDFAEVFNCPKNSRMNPEKKCSIW